MGKSVRFMVVIRISDQKHFADNSQSSIHRSLSTGIPLACMTGLFGWSFLRHRPYSTVVYTKVDSLRSKSNSWQPG